MATSADTAVGKPISILNVTYPEDGSKLSFPSSCKPYVSHATKKYKLSEKVYTQQNQVVHWQELNHSCSCVGYGHGAFYCYKLFASFIRRNPLFKHILIKARNMNNSYDL